MTKLNNTSKVWYFSDSHHCLVLFKAAIKCISTFDPAIQKWESQPKNDQPFAKFHPFIDKEFFKATTQKLTAHAIGFGIANNIEAVNPFTNYTANLVLETTAELVDAASTQNDKKLDDLKKFRQECWTPSKIYTKSNPLTNAKLGSNHHLHMSQCPHCRHLHPNILHDKC